MQKTRARTQLGNITTENFLQNYWQKKPLLIRNAFNNLDTLVSPEELAGFALEEDVISRLIIETPSQQPLQSQWQLEHGPLQEQTFAELPENFWTLLIQHADQLHPGVNSLLNAFSFLPQWRLDDVMISFATNGGGVGPHFDYYDVFLLQGIGKRHWRIGQTCDDQSALQKNVPMKVLTEFETQFEWEVNTGDLLYIPAKWAHWGKAVGNSITYSIGFRAPSHQDILLGLSQELTDNLSNDLRYEDSPQSLNERNTAQISEHAINSVKDVLQRYLANPTAIANWLGKTMTEPNPGLMIEDDQAIDANELTSTDSITLTPIAKAAFHILEKNKTAQLFINGERYLCHPTIADKLCNRHPIKIKDLGQSEKKLISILANYGYIISAK